jgi:hypothetical protein
MGYDIRPIAELESFDFSLCSGYPGSGTVSGDAVRFTITRLF